VSTGVRRIAYVLAMLFLMWFTTTTTFLDLCTSLLGDDIGTAQATFWNLQCETYYTVVMVIFVLEWTWGLRRDAHGWTVETPTTARRLSTYALFAALAVLMAAERPVREVLEVALPNDIAFSIAHYLRRGLEAPLTILPLLVFFDGVLPFHRRDRMALRSPSTVAG
jgi:hypothetical protein